MSSKSERILLINTFIFNVIGSYHDGNEIIIGADERQHKEDKDEA